MAAARLTIVVSVVIVLFIGLCLGFIVGWFSHATRRSAHARGGDPGVAGRLRDEVDPRNIREHLRWLTSRPHLAGTPGERAVADYIAASWRESGLSAVRLVPYDVLLSYPDPARPSHVVLRDGQGAARYTTQLVEHIVRQEQNQSDVVPPFNAYSPPGNPRGVLVYVNYGRVEDFNLIRERVNLTGKICIARYGKIFRADKAALGQQHGCVGVILYTDPKDFAVSGVTAVYPDSWWLPGTGVQRGTLKLSNGGLGDPLTPFYPSIESAYRIPMADAGLLRIPVHPIGYDDARALLENMAGEEAPESWRGGLNVTYRLGPGYTDPGWTVQMHISTDMHRATTYNVIGFIEGSLEPDRYVLVGNHHDAWVFGAVDPSSGTATMLELARALGKQYVEGWRPKRTIVFCAWGAEEQGLIGSREWVENFGQILSDRAVVYLNVDSAVQGQFSMRVRALPLAMSTVYDVAKQIPNPDPEEVAQGRETVYDTWALRSPSDNASATPSLPRVPLLGSGSDFAPFITGVGVTCVDMRYHFDESLGISSYPLYHSVYETMHLYETFIDPTFKFAGAVAQYWGELARRYADYALLPLDVTDLARAIDGYLGAFERRFGALLLNNDCESGLRFLRVSVTSFSEAARKFQERIDHADVHNTLLMRQINDQLMSLERSFIDPVGLPNRPLVRNVLYAPSAHDSYASTSLPGLVDSLFQIEGVGGGEEGRRRWEGVRKQLASLAFFIDSATSALADPTQF